MFKYGGIDMKNTQKNRLVWVPAAVALILAITNVKAEPSAEAEKPVYGEYKDWRVLGVSHRLDKKFVRAILGNHTAINAAQSGKTIPWPDGTIIAKLSWTEKIHPNWPQAIIPGEFACFACHTPMKDHDYTFPVLQ